MEKQEKFAASADAKCEFSYLRYEVCGEVVVITYNRPERRNAWSVDLVRETIAAIRLANTDDSVGAIVLTGEGAAYCGGADLKDERQVDPISGRRLTPATFTMGAGENNWISLLAESKPVVVALNGPAVGIGATHILSADIRLAAESATISFPFLKLGAMPECGSTALLSHIIGAGRAMDLTLRCAEITAKEALNIGLVTQVFPDHELRDAALHLAAGIAALPRLQVKLTKRMFLQNACPQSADDIMRVEGRAFVELLKGLKREKPL